MTEGREGDRHRSHERREEPRGLLPSPCPCLFYVADRYHPAFMVDLSAKGAGFRTMELATSVEVEVGGIVHFDVISPFGRTPCKGRIAWIKPLKQGYAWGVCFSERLVRGHGPLGALLITAIGAS